MPKYEKPWEAKIEPFRVVGNVYFVGNYQTSCHLIDTGDGLILIDPGCANIFYLVLHNIYELGFNPKDIKYIINTHWHIDHTEATAALADISGAKTLIGRYDDEKTRKFFDPDILISDGDEITLGNTTVTFMETPGHTKGTISFFFNTEENGKTYRVAMYGGAGVNTMVPERFDYDGCREGFRDSINRLRKEKVDVVLGNHVGQTNIAGKAKILLETGENKFIDENFWQEFLNWCEKRLDDTIAKDAK